MHKDRVGEILSPAERRIFSRLNSPIKLQDYVDRLPINFEHSGDTYWSPRLVLRNNSAHCLEGALFAAAVFAYHGEKPLLMDLKTINPDVDHVVTLFKRDGHWGAISKTNHAVLRYRDPIYKSVRELALSYFHEYYLGDGRKSLRSYSAPFDLSKFNPERWIIAEEKLDWLVTKLDRSRHVPIASRGQIRALRKTTDFEIDVTVVPEWKEPKRKRRRG